MKLVARYALVALMGAWLGCFSSSSELEPPPPTGCGDRVEAFFEATLDAAPTNTYSEIIRVERGVAPDESKIQFDLDRLIRLEDTSDFKLPGLLWML